MFLRVVELLAILPSRSNADFEICTGAQQKEAFALKQEAQEGGVLQGKGIEELEALENKANGGEAAAEWEESKEIMRQALKHEEQDENKSSAWKKLMNLLMQLRKVRLRTSQRSIADPE